MSRNLILLMVSVFIFNSGCSVYMAAKQPDKKDLSVFDKGTKRAYVIAECGKPNYSEERDGKKVDYFSFLQGYSSGAKAGRALFHGAADVVTLGLWEVVGTPVESVADGTEVKVEVRYDENDRVDHVNVLKGEYRFNKPSDEPPQPVTSYQDSNLR